MRVDVVLAAEEVEVALPVVGEALEPVVPQAVKLKTKPIVIARNNC
jgi:hypothetical protein